MTLRPFGVIVTRCVLLSDSVVSRVMYPPLSSFFKETATAAGEISSSRAISTWEQFGDLSASKAGADSDRLPYDSPFFQYNGAAADPCVETEMTACLPVSDSRSASHFVLVPSHFPLVN